MSELEKSSQRTGQRSAQNCPELPIPQKSSQLEGATETSHAPKCPAVPRLEFSRSPSSLVFVHAPSKVLPTRLRQHLGCVRGIDRDVVLEAVVADVLEQIL